MREPIPDACAVYCWKVRLGLIGFVVLAGCGARVLAGSESSGSTSGAVVLDDGGQGTTDEPEPKNDVAGTPDVPPPAVGCDQENPCLLDILVVIDNSATMLDAQGAVVRGLMRLVGELEAHVEGYEHPVDVQMMFTTTDAGNPECQQFSPAGYVPAMGAPTTIPCNLRLDAFTGLGSNPDVAPELCTDLCPLIVELSDPFVAFYRDEDNIPEGMYRDIDGDGIDESPAAQAVACLAPQGINGCGYEAPLEAMRLALNPGAAWNTGDRPFLRQGSDVIIVIATDETDCSMNDFNVMYDPQYMNVNPDNGNVQVSSALCWNAGVACEGPDALGVYSDCSVTNEPLLPVSRYTDLLVGELRELQGRDVAMVAITGVPLVTERNPASPFEPTAGGLADLVIREWRDGPYPDGDLLPSDTRDGNTTADFMFDFGVGPGCSFVDAETDHAARGIPNPRVTDVCRSLDTDDDNGAFVRCCVESVCDPIAAFDCISGWIADSSTNIPGG